jgi:predicted enzyme related to lactoylglutathione lyase
MSIKSMNLAWINVSDIKKAEKFFVDTLGLKVTSGAPEYNWLELKGSQGGMILGVGQGDCSKKEENPVKPGGNAVMTMEVEDVAQSKTELEAKGVKFYGDILEVPGHVKMATFADPDGNIFQLCQMLTSSSKGCC